MERTAEAEGALRQRIAVRSYHRHAIELPLELRLGADFQPMLELRGIVPTARAAAARRRGGGLLAPRARRSAAHDRDPRNAGAAPARDGSLVFDLELEARGATDLVVDFEVSESTDGQVSRALPRRRSTRALA